jgi:hypothetical protein
MVGFSPRSQPPFLILIINLINQLLVTCSINNDKLMIFVPHIEGEEDEICGLYAVMNHLENLEISSPTIPQPALQSESDFELWNDLQAYIIKSPVNSSSQVRSPPLKKFKSEKESESTQPGSFAWQYMVNAKYKNQLSKVRTVCNVLSSPEEILKDPHLPCNKSLPE